MVQFKRLSTVRRISTNKILEQEKSASAAVKQEVARQQRISLMQKLKPRARAIELDEDIDDQDIALKYMTPIQKHNFFLRKRIEQINKPVFKQLRDFIHNNNVKMTIKKELIFGYPPMQFKDTSDVVNSGSEYVDEQHLVEKQVKGLWGLLGKHIYGQNDLSENQLKEMFQRHGEREELDKRIMNDFQLGRKISLKNLTEENHRSCSPPTPERKHAQKGIIFTEDNQKKSGMGINQSLLMRSLKFADTPFLAKKGSTAVASPQGGKNVTSPNPQKRGSILLQGSLNVPEFMLQTKTLLQDKSKKSLSPSKRTTNYELLPETIEFTKEFDRFRRNISVEVNKTIRQIDQQEKEHQEKLKAAWLKLRNKSPLSQSPLQTKRDTNRSLSPECKTQQKKPILAAKNREQLTQSMNVKSYNTHEIKGQGSICGSVNNPEGEIEIIKAPFLKVQWIPKQKPKRIWSPRVETANTVHSSINGSTKNLIPSSQTLHKNQSSISPRLNTARASRMNQGQLNTELTPYVSHMRIKVPTKAPSSNQVSMPLINIQSGNARLKKESTRSSQNFCATNELLNIYLIQHYQQNIVHNFYSISWRSYFFSQNSRVKDLNIPI